MSPRPAKYRFYLDENFPVPAGEFLKSRGHNVVYVTRLLKFRSKSDLQQINNAAKEDRILVALDKDFLVNKNLQNAINKSSGVLLICSSDPRSSQVIKILNKVLQSKTLNNIRSKLCSASINKIDLKETIILK